MSCMRLRNVFKVSQIWRFNNVFATSSKPHKLCFADVYAVSSKPHIFDDFRVFGASSKPHRFIVLLVSLWHLRNFTNSISCGRLYDVLKISKIWCLSTCLMFCGRPRDAFKACELDVLKTFSQHLQNVTNSAFADVIATCYKPQTFDDFGVFETSLIYDQSIFSGVLITFPKPHKIYILLASMLRHLDLKKFMFRLRLGNVSKTSQIWWLVTFTRRL